MCSPNRSPHNNLPTIYDPTVENYKEVREIIHEKPVLKETVVEPAITRAEFEAKYGKKVETVDAQQVSGGQQHTGDLRSSTSSATNSSVSTKGSAPTANTASSSSSKAVHASSSASDAKRSAEKAASDKLQVAKSKLTEGSADHSDDSYSMSSSNMAREAAEGDSSSSSGGSGLGAALKNPLKAAKNLVDKIID
jgi:hypothetical protein